MNTNESNPLKRRLLNEKRVREERKKQAEKPKKQLTKSKQRQKKREATLKEYQDLDREEKLYKKFKQGKIDKATFDSLVAEIK